MMPEVGNDIFYIGIDGHFYRNRERLSKPLNKDWKKYRNILQKIYDGTALSRKEEEWADSYYKECFKPKEVEK